MDSAARLLAAGEELMADKVFMVAENSQYISEIVAAQKLIRDGAIGEVLTARAKYWESCSYALNPTWASSYEPGTFYCTADEGFTFDGGLHWCAQYTYSTSQTHARSALNSSVCTGKK